MRKPSKPYGHAFIELSKVSSPEGITVLATTDEMVDLSSQIREATAKILAAANMEIATDKWRQEQDPGDEDDR